jgi:hypothetical protein
MTTQGAGGVSVQEANTIHHLLLADPAFYWEGGEDGCYARALLMVDRMVREGLPSIAVGKILVLHKAAPRRGWAMQTRLGGTQTWMQHLAPTLLTDVGPYVIDPTLCDWAEEERQWLMRFPAEALNPAVVPPTPRFIQTVLRCSDVAFRQLLALAARTPEYYKHLLSDPGVAARLEQLGSPVRHWLERGGPIAETLDDHLTRLPTAANQTGPLVRGEVVRVAHGMDFFSDVFWDTAGRFGRRGVSDAALELTRLRQKATP